MALWRMLKTALRALWHGLDGVRKVLHLVVLVFLFSLLVAALSPPTPQLPRKAALLIAPTGYLVEELEGDPVDRALAEAMGDGVGQTLVRDVQEALRWAAEDERIPAVVLQLDGFLGGGLTKLEAVAEAIESFRATGKPVLAMGNVYTQSAYFLAAHADETWIQNQGLVFIDGYGVYRNYYRDAIDKLGIDWNVFTAGTYKTFAEPFTRNDMSEPARESNLAVLKQLWGAWRDAVAAKRGMQPDRLQAVIDGLPDELAASEGNFADMAARVGLVDRVASRAEFREHMIGIAGEDDESGDSYRSVGLSAYLEARRFERGDRTRERNVAVVVAAGSIIEGEAPPGTIGGDSTSQLIRRALNDESVEGLVLRVDSGGGSVLASEVIADEVRAFKASGRPVVVSMSSVAASGGYWIAAPADEILAQPTTVTGSIGVVAMFPTFQRTLGKIGINTDGVGTTALSGTFRPDRELTDAARRTLELLVEGNYREFVSGVAAQRELEVAAVERVAGGRIWTGRDALEFGLVDRLGDLDDAIETAAALAELGENDYGVKYVSRELSPSQELLLQILRSRVGPAFAGLGLAGRPDGLGSVVKAVEKAWRSLSRFNDPGGLYADCFCDVLR